MPTDRPNNPSNLAPQPGSLTAADDIAAQRHVDEELTADADGLFMQRVAQQQTLAAHVQAHRNLKAAVAHAFITETLPASHEELRARIAKLLTGRGPEVVGRIGALRARAKGPAHRLRPAHRRASGVAIAASLLLVAGSVLLGIFGPTIGDLSRAAATPMTEVARHAAGEHDRCSESDAQRAAKAPFHTPEQAAAELSAHLGAPVAIRDLSSLGYSFCCAGFCAVPGAESHSGHIMYSRTDASTGSLSWVSLFIAPADHDYYALDAFGRRVPVEQGRLYAESPDNDSFRKPQSRIIGWRDRSLIYFLRVSSEADAASVVAELAPVYRRTPPLR